MCVPEALRHMQYFRARVSYSMQGYNSQVYIVAYY